MKLSDLISEETKKKEPQSLNSMVEEQTKPKLTLSEHDYADILSRFQGGVGTVSQEEYEALSPEFRKNLKIVGTPQSMIAQSLMAIPVQGPEYAAARGVEWLLSKIGLTRGAKYIESAQASRPAEGLLSKTAESLRSVSPEATTQAGKFGTTVIPKPPSSIELEASKAQSEKLFNDIYWNYSPYSKHYSNLDKSKILREDLVNTRGRMGKLLQEQELAIKRAANPVEIELIKSNFNQQLAPLKEIETQLKTAFDKIEYVSKANYERITSTYNKPSIKGLSPDDVVASSHTPSALNKEHYDLLEAKIPYEEVSGLRGEIKKAWGEIGSIWKSAYSKLAYEPTGRGPVAYQILEESHRNKVGWLNKEHESFLKSIKDIKPRSADDKELGRLLNTYEDWTKIPIFEQTNIKPNIKAAFEYMRPNWSRNYDELVAMGIAKPERKLEAYLFHTFPKGQIVAGWRGRAEAIQNQLASSGIDEKLSSKLTTELSEILENIRVWEKQGTLLYRNIPKTIKAPFLEERLGAEGYDLFAIPAYERWLGIAARKRFDEPALRKYLELTKGMPTEYKRYAHQFARDYFGYETGKFDQIKKIEHYVASLEYIHAMALNPRIAVQNLTQELNTLVEVGPTAWGKGISRALSKEGKAEWAASHHSREIPGLTGVSERAGMVSKLASKGAYLHQKTESALRRHAYAAGIEKGLAQGLPYDLQLKAGDQAIQWTQFMYGQTAGRQILKAPGATVGLQFGTFGMGQVELFEHWARTNPKKLVAYLALANGIAAGTSYGLKEVGERFAPGAEQFAIDLWVSIGIGSDPVELAKAVRELFTGETKAAGIRAQASLPRVLGGGAELGTLPQFSFPSYQTTKNILTRDLSHIMPVQMRRMYEGGRALFEGETQSTLETPKTSPGLPGIDIESGYPLRELSWGKEREDLRFLMSPAEIAIRSLAFKPWKEAEVQKMRTTERILASRRKDLITDFQDNILPLVLKGRSPEATHLLSKHNPEALASIIEEIPKLAKDALKRSTLTQHERTALEAWTNKQRMIFRIGIGQTSGDKTKSSP